MDYSYSDGDTVAKLFLNASKKWENRVAVKERDSVGWQEFTWHQYLINVFAFALGLRELGLERGMKVGIQSNNNARWLFADMAVQCLGAVTVGIYPTNPAAEIQFVMEDSQSVFFIGQGKSEIDKILSVRDQLPSLKLIICMNTQDAEAYHDQMIMGFEQVQKLGQQVLQAKSRLLEEIIQAGSSDEYSVFIYTSGTTGNPKGVMHTHRGILRSAEPFSRELELNAYDSHLSYLPLCHGLERNCAIYSQLMNGYTVNFSSGSDKLLEELKETNPTFFVAVPRILEKIKAEILKVKTGQKSFNPSQVGLGKAHCIICAGAPSSKEVMLFLKEHGIEVREAFGMTELLSLITMHRKHQIKIGTAGPPLPGCDLKTAEDGELLAKTPGLFGGYANLPEETKANFTEDGYFKTGDLAEFDEDGHMKIIGRKKDIIITSGGKNISPNYIESLLKASPYIAEAVLVGDGRKYLTSLIQIDKENVGAWVQQQGISYSDFQGLTQLEEVKNLIADEVEKVNTQISRVEQIKKFDLIREELSQTAGDVTATQKVKRAKITKKYTQQIEAMYA
ncbi:MAG: AMP-binding protein [Clostridia bacterium]|nr:AMP-binding protein [Clostridia bacterium]